MPRAKQTVRRSSAKKTRGRGRPKGSTNKTTKKTTTAKKTTKKTVTRRSSITTARRHADVRRTSAGAKLAIADLDKKYGGPMMEAIMTIAGLFARNAGRVTLKVDDINASLEVHYLLKKIGRRVKAFKAVVRKRRKSV